MQGKNNHVKRVSKRTYPSKICQKPNCNIEFIPTDARQVYCNAQHRIDSNNDKRKEIDSIERDFNKTARNNKYILKKVSESLFYIKNGKVNASLLEYEGYDHTVYHRICKDDKTKREIKFCFNYGLTLSESDQQFFKIIIEKNENI
jgi:hypothetical protein